VISLVRVDNRLIHGQVVEAWLPALKAERIVVADDEAATNSLVRAAMGLAVPLQIAVRIEALFSVPYSSLNADSVRTLLLVRDVAGVIAAHERGLKLTHLNLGNIHFERGRQRVSASVFLSQTELDQLKALAEQGVEVEARAVPSDVRVTLAEMQQRFSKAT
jgi:mannose/fructose/N-acetylgalactosamine-specific phosphotransferase system component IIB